MRAPAVVVTDIDAEDAFELAATDDQQPVEAFPPNGADPALHMGVRVRCPHGCADDLDLLVLEEGVEGTGELGLAVVDQEPVGYETLGPPCDVEVSGILSSTCLQIADAGERLITSATDPYI